MSEQQSNRRWFRPRLGLRSLFVIMAFLAIAFAWYAHRLHIIEAERAKLIGTWMMDDGFRVELPDAMVDIGIPSDGIGQVDFHVIGGGISRGLYRFNGDKIEVAQNETGEPRPIGFDKDKVHSLWTAERIASSKSQQ